MAKRTRRERRQEIGKQRQSAPPHITPVETAVAEAAPSTVGDEFPPPLKAAQAASINNRKALNFAQEYFYVYSELKNVLIITALMLAVMVGLAFVI
ncbi:MAG TPA: hypothetical protein VEC96_13300 [Anaerolineae bacterium]|nr:hypothetical protein [Anaerolineae bacterium]HXV96832.1 hypothetical protein [Anaerolineae bacterium]